MKTGKKRKGRPLKLHADRAVAYVRVSTEMQENGPEAQRHAIEAWAGSNGTTIVAWHEEHLTGVTPLDARHAMLTAIHDLDTQRAGVLVVDKRDRLARDTLTALLIGRMVTDKGARLHALDGPIDDGSPEARLHLGLLDLFAEHERARTRLRVAAALAAKARRGELVGTAHFGTRAKASDRVSARTKRPIKVLEAEPAEAAAVAFIFDLRRAGTTLHGIVDALDRSQHRPRGGRWHYNSVRRILARGRSG